MILWFPLNHYWNNNSGKYRRCRSPYRSLNFSRLLLSLSLGRETSSLSRDLARRGDSWNSGYPYRAVMAIYCQHHLLSSGSNSEFKPSHIFIVHEEVLPSCLIDLSLIHFAEKQNTSWPEECVLCNIVTRFWVLGVISEHHLGSTLLWEKRMKFESVFINIKQRTAQVSFLKIIKHTPLK